MSWMTSPDEVLAKWDKTRLLLGNQSLSKQLRQKSQGPISVWSPAAKLEKLSTWSKEKHQKLPNLAWRKHKNARKEFLLKIALWSCALLWGTGQGHLVSAGGGPSPFNPHCSLSVPEGLTQLTSSRVCFVHSYTSFSSCRSLWVSLSIRYRHAEMSNTVWEQHSAAQLVFVYRHSRSTWDLAASRPKHRGLCRGGLQNVGVKIIWRTTFQVFQNTFCIKINKVIF